MKLVMTLLVKNEADIIADNIRFHAEQGVDAFLVMDNNSDDGTTEILEALANEFELTVVHETGLYQQAKWMTRLARQARHELGADLIISNDADEFWAASHGGSLKEKLHSHESVVTVKRFNYLLSAEQFAQDMPYWQSAHKVVSPILYSSGDQLARQGLSMPLVKISPKTIINPHGLLKIKGGNHRARHLMFWRDRSEEGIEVHHFPIRSYRQFAQNIANRKKLLEQNPQTRMGDHYRRWVAQLQEGTLEQEFSKIALLESDIAVLEKVGIIQSLPSHLLAFKAGHSAA